MGFFSSDQSACVISVVLVLALCCATSAHARAGSFYSQIEATNQVSVSLRSTAELKIPTPMANQATGSQVVKPSIESELRYAPSGPDPMHHHASPKRPQAP